MEINLKDFAATNKSSFSLRKIPTLIDPLYGNKDHYKSPWYVIPADDKKNARLIVSKIIVETLKGLKLAYPKASKERQKELLKFRDILVKQENEPE